MNRKWLKIGSLAAVAAMAGLVAFSSSAAAQTTGPAQAQARGRGMGGSGMGMMTQGRMGGPANSLVAVAATTLNMSQTDLVAALNTGQTIADVAQDKGVALNTIVDAFIAPRVEMLKAAVASGRITQAQADANLAAMTANVTAQLSAEFSPRGAGAGTGFVDSDGNGVCDNMPATGQTGTQSGPMNRGGGRWNR